MSDLVRPLEAAWREALDRVLVGRGFAISDVARLAPRLAELSRAYNDGVAEGKKTRLPLDARIAFSFPRDVPKGAAAVRELVASGALSVGESPLRVVDLGAGLGAMTWGVARALGTDRIDALLVDEDPEVLQAAAAIAKEAPAKIAVTTRVGSVADYVPEPADLVIFGQVLSELSPRADPAARVDEHTALIRKWLHVAKHVVIVEPALRDRTRHLHAIHDRLTAHVVAPCLHQSACPALATEDDWCHEDLADLDLPDWVAPLARAAGLRYQGLTFSYLVLRREPVVRSRTPGSIRFRVTSDLLKSKGKVELFACAEDGKRTRIRRLERHGDEFDALRRGDVVTMTPPADERGRVAEHVQVDVGPLRR